jgi:hypothetical protein
MRATNVPGSHPSAGLAGLGTKKSIFAFFGANANPNTNPNNTDSYVDLLYRNDKYDGTGNWFSASNTGSTDCPSLSTAAPSTGDVSNDKMGTYFNYLFTGITDIPNGSIVPALAVTEGNYNVNYPAGQASFYPPPPGTTTSNSPYATVTYFADGGNLPTVPQGPNHARFCDQYPIGSKVMVMVYDGVVTNPGGTAPFVVTIIGYGIIQIDGYSNGGGGGGVPGNLKASGNTAYGHAVPHNLPGQSDPYLIQLPAGATCADVMAIIRSVQDEYPTAKLVDSSNNMHYGMTAH